MSARRKNLCEGIFCHTRTHALSCISLVAIPYMYVSKKLCVSPTSSNNTNNIPLGTLHYIIRGEDRSTTHWHSDSRPILPLPNSSRSLLRHTLSSHSRMSCYVLIRTLRYPDFKSFPSLYSYTHMSKSCRFLWMGFARLDKKTIESILLCWGWTFRLLPLSEAFEALLDKLMLVRKLHFLTVVPI